MASFSSCSIVGMRRFKHKRSPKSLYALFSREAMPARIRSGPKLAGIFSADLGRCDFVHDFPSLKGDGVMRWEDLIVIDNWSRGLRW